MAATALPRVGLAAWGEDLGEMLDAGRAADAGGFDAVWTSELHRSPLVPLAALATSTTRIGLGTAIALAFVRSPLSLALSALDLDELSGGRVRLGLGAGVKRLNEDWHSAEFDRPALRLRETIQAVRTFVAQAHLGEPIDVEGELVTARIRGYQRPYPPVRTAIPIHVAAVGPLMTRMAGEIGDGWISHELTSPKFLAERATPWLHEGLDRGGRDRNQIELVASQCCVIDADGAAARRSAAHTVAFYASVKSYDDFFAFHGFGEEAASVRTAFAAGDTTAMVDAVTDEMVRAFTLAGTADDVRGRLAELGEHVDTVKVSPPTYFQDAEATRAAQAAILEHLSA